MRDAVLTNLLPETNSIVPDIEEFFKAPYEDVLLEEIELNLTSG